MHIFRSHAFILHDVVIEIGDGTMNGKRVKFFICNPTSSVAKLYSQHADNELWFY